MGLSTLTLKSLRQDPFAAVEAIAADGQPRLLTRRGEPVAMLLAIDAYRRLEHELDLLRKLALGELESAGDQGHPLAEVLAECDSLLNGK